MASDSRERSPSGRSISFIAQALVALGGVCLLGSCTKAAEVTVLPSTVLLDPAEPGARKSIELVVKNTGNVPTMVVAVQLSCCGSAVIASITQPIAPGGSVTVSVPFEYPIRSGKFTERVYVNTYYDNKSHPFRREVAVVGSVQPTVSLCPRSIVAEITQAAQSANALFTVRLLHEGAVWREARVEEIALRGTENAFDLTDVMLRTDPSEREILGTIHWDTSDLAAGEPLVGVVQLKLKSSRKDYELELPFKVTRQNVRLTPQSIVLDEGGSATVVGELPSGVSLDRVTLTQGNKEIQFRKELRDYGKCGKVVTVTLHPRANPLPQGLKFATLSFAFSDGSLLRRPLVRSRAETIKKETES